MCACQWIYKKPSCVPVFMLAAITALSERDASNPGENLVDVSVEFLQLGVNIEGLGSDSRVKSLDTDSNSSTASNVAEIENRRHQELHQAARGNRRTPYRQVLHNYNDIQYSATLTVGGQEIEGILDTGSFEMLVLSENCTSCGGTKLYYNGSESATYELEQRDISYTHSFGSGTTYSHLAYDDVQIGPFEIDRQYFWEVTAANMPILSIHNSFQAIVGVGPTATMKKINYAEAGQAKVIDKAFGIAHLPTPSSIEDQEAESLFLASQQTILENMHTNIFSVCFLREKESHGYFVWNDDDPREDPSKFTRLPVIGNVHWGVTLENVRFQGGSFSGGGLACSGEKGCAAIVDSGTSLIAVPSAVANKAFEQLNTIEDVSCDDISSFPTLDFSLGGHHISLPPEAYIMEITGQLPLGPFGWLPIPTKFELCTLGFITMDVETSYGPMWIIGMPFFREYYTTFHLGDNAWNAENRSLFVAKSGDDCTPAEGGGASTTILAQRSSRRPRRVDLSQVSVSMKVQQLASQGFSAF